MCIKTSSRSLDSIIRKLQNLISQYIPPKRFFSDKGLPFLSGALQMFLAMQYIDHIVIPHCPKSNAFTEIQIKTIKTAFDTAKSSGGSLDGLLLSLKDQHQLDPTFPLPREILHNRIQDRPVQPSHPIDFQEIRDYLLTQKSIQKKHHGKRHNTRDLPELHPGQPVLFLSLADVNLHIEGTIMGPSTTPCSYMIEATRHHICPIHTDTPPFPRPSMHQGNPIPGPSAQQDPSFQDRPVTKIAPLKDHL